MVSIKARVCEVADSQIEKIKQVAMESGGAFAGFAEHAKHSIKAKTVWIQNGYIYVGLKIDGTVQPVRAKVSEIVDIVKTKAFQGIQLVDDSTAPGRARAV